MKRTTDILKRMKIVLASLTLFSVAGLALAGGFSAATDFPVGAAASTFNSVAPRRQRCPPACSCSSSDTPRHLAVGDLNGDGLPDIVTANAQGSISVLLNGRTF